MGAVMHPRFARRRLAVALGRLQIPPDIKQKLIATAEADDTTENDVARLEAFHTDISGFSCVRCGGITIAQTVGDFYGETPLAQRICTQCSAFWVYFFTPLLRKFYIAIDARQKPPCTTWVAHTRDEIEAHHRKERSGVCAAE